MDRMNPMLQIAAMMDRIEPSLSFTDDCAVPQWRAVALSKLRALTGIDDFTEVDPSMRVEWEKKRDGYVEIRFVIAVEECFDMPCHLLLPDNVNHPSLMVCLQGHSNGMHISLGTPRFSGDKEMIAGGRDFGIQAVTRGMAALCIEQRYFGERCEHPDEPGTECWIPSMAELMLGRTAIAGRVWDVSQALNAITRFFPMIDMTRVGIMGNSGGGTAAFYTACLEPRITTVMPSCAVCTYRASIAVIRHCMDNHIPGILKWFEMADLVGLIAPKPLVVVAGCEDNIFPLEGVEEAFAKIKRIYKACGAPDACRLVVGGEGHRFYPEEAWPVFKELTGW